MSFEEFGKILNRTLFLSLDRISGAAAGALRLHSRARALQPSGASITSSATFRTGFFDGLWGLVEIGVFGLFGLTAAARRLRGADRLFRGQPGRRARGQPRRNADKPDRRGARRHRAARRRRDRGRRDRRNWRNRRPAKPPAKRAATASQRLRCQGAPVRRTPRTAKRSPKPPARHRLPTRPDTAAPR